MADSEFVDVPYPTVEQTTQFFTDLGLGGADDIPPVETTTSTTETTPPVTEPAPGPAETPPAIPPVTTTTPPTEPATTPPDTTPQTQATPEQTPAVQSQEPPQQSAADKKLEEMAQAQVRLAESVKALAESMVTLRQPPAPQQAAPQQQAPPPQPPDLSSLIEIPEELQTELANAREAFDTKAEAKAFAKINLWQMQKKDEIQQAAAQVKAQQQAQAQTGRNESLARGYAKLSQKYGPQTIEASSQEIVDLLLKGSPELNRMLQVDPEAALIAGFEIVNARHTVRTAPSVAPAPVAVTDIAKMIIDPAIKQAMKDAMKDEITAEYLQSIKDGQPPIIMGAGSGGAARPVMAPAEELQDLEASKKAWLASGMI